MFRITGEILGEVQFDRAFTRLVSTTGDLRVPFEKIGEDFRDIMKEQFDAEGRKTKWAELSPRYKAWKERYFPGNKILVLFGILRAAMTNKKAFGNVSRVDKLSAEFGADGKTGQIGVWHQLGTSKMPARRIIDLTEGDKRLFTKTVHTYAIRLGKEAGFEVR